MIGISTWNNGAYKSIETWLRAFKQDIEFIELGAAADPIAALSQCTSLILPGGCDPNPALYGKEDPHGLCTVDDARDALELSLIHKALEFGLPILGICRGFQLVNVALGGSLILDLPSIGIHGHQHNDHTPLIRGSICREEISAANRGDSSSPHDVGGQRGVISDDDGVAHLLSPLGRESSSGNKVADPALTEGPRGNSSFDVYHEIAITPGSLLHRITGQERATVNSNHHQGIDTVAPCLIPTAFAHDGVIEALELNPDYVNKQLTVTAPHTFSHFKLHTSNFLLLHFHPERMEYSHPCSKAVAEWWFGVCGE